MPCIYRRAALNKIGLDNGLLYGNDFCIGEVNLNSNKISTYDFRACVSFLRRNMTREAISKALIANSKIDILNIDTYVDVVIRAMNEIRSLLRVKASDDIKRKAGLL